MDYAHRQGVRHNDLKPANILVNQDGQPKLLDFGIAALPGEVSQGYTPRYASREQKRGEPLDERSDVYSLGSVLSELVAGERKPADLANLLAKGAGRYAGRKVSHAAAIGGRNQELYWLGDPWRRTTGECSTGQESSRRGTAGGWRRWPCRSSWRALRGPRARSRCRRRRMWNG